MCDLIFIGFVKDVLYHYTGLGSGVQQIHHPEEGLYTTSHRQVVYRPSEGWCICVHHDPNLCYGCILNPQGIFGHHMWYPWRPMMYRLINIHGMVYNPVHHATGS